MKFRRLEYRCGRAVQSGLDFSNACAFAMLASAAWVPQVGVREGAACIRRFQLWLQLWVTSGLVWRTEPLFNQSKIQRVQPLVRLRAFESYWVEVSFVLALFSQWLRAVRLLPLPDPLGRTLFVGEVHEVSRQP